MRQDIEKILDDVASCYSDYASPNEKTVPEATEAILELIKGAVPPELDSADNYYDGWNACHQAMLDKLEDKS